MKVEVRGVLPLPPPQEIQIVLDRDAAMELYLALGPLTGSGIYEIYSGLSKKLYPFHDAL